MFTEYQGHKGHHPSKQLLLKASFKASVTKHSEQLNRSLCYIQLHIPLCSGTQQSRVTQSCLLLSPQLQLPELPEASGTTWSFWSAIQHQAGCRRPDPTCNPSFCGWACSCQKQRLWMSNPMRIWAASCSLNARQLQPGGAAGARRRNRTTTQQRGEGEIAQQHKGAQPKAHFFF